MIDTETLRKKVIDLAIQGKLTEQLQSDGDAETLYAKILDQKSQLIKEGKIKKDKSLPNIAEDEIPFEIPKNWKWIRWGDLSEKIQYGYNAPAKPSGRIKMVRISDIQEGIVQWDDVPYCDIEEDSIEDYLLRVNDILFARTGGTVGKSYIVSNIPEEAVFAGYLIRTSYSSDIYSPYMKYFMESGLYWKQLQNGTIATAQPNCNGKTLSKMIVPFPPYAEQKRISEKIDEILAQIDIVDDLQAKYSDDLAVLKSKIIDAGIRGKLTEQLSEDGDAEDLYAQILNQKSKLIKEGKIKKEKSLPDIATDEIPFEIPKKWKWERLGNIIKTCHQGINTAGDHVQFVKENGVPIIQTGDITNGTINVTATKLMSWEDYELYKEKYQPMYNDIFYCNIGTIGKPLIYRENYTMLFHWNIFLIKYFDDLVLPEYMKIYLESFTNYFKKKTSGVAMEFVSKKKILEAAFPLPPIEEQKRIVKKIEAILEQLQ